MTARMRLGSCPALVFDEHTPSLLALANLLVPDPATAEIVIGSVLVEHAPATPAGTSSEDIRRGLALAVVTACRRDRSGEATEGDVRDRQGRVAVGLAVYAHLSYRDIAREMAVSDRQALELLRNGLLELGHAVRSDRTHVG